jgi:hypothetical protein
MFGYVMPNKNELKIREFEVYNSYYCAICHSIRDRYGQLPRLLLTYDSVFLAMLLSAIKEDKDVISTFRCGTHLTKERNIVTATCEIDYASDMLLLLGYYKLRDDYEDEKSMVGLTGSLFLKRAFKKIESKYPEKSAKIHEYMKQLSEIEKLNSQIFDEVAEPFSHIMEEIFEYEDIPSDEYIKEYRKIGFHLGKWIYLLDAFDDLEKDIKRKNYNPVINQFGFDKDDYLGESLDDFKSRTNERIRLNLELYLANIGEAVNKIELKKNKEIIGNIVYLGLLGKTDEILGRSKGFSDEQTEGILNESI